MATNIGPLTATFTPPAGCLEQIYGTATTETRGTATTGHKWHILGGTSAGDCYPQNFIPGPTAYYSPGVCPSGWAMASSTAEMVQTLTESRAVCCPSGYRYSPATASESLLSSLACFSSAQWPTTVTLRVPDVENARSIQTTLTDVLIEVRATPIYVRFAQSQSATSTSTSGTPPAQTSREGSAANNGTVSLDVGLSVGAKAGIGAAVGVAALVAVIGVLVFWLRRRAASRDRKGEAGEQHVGDGNTYNPNGQGHIYGGEPVEKGWDGLDPSMAQLDDTARAQAEMHGQGVASPDERRSTPTPPYQLSDSVGVEMATRSNTHEMQARELPKELP
ncbi:hypothetical protein RB595_000202 [Gaeumannomyces hyphopodioides]